MPNVALQTTFDSYPSEITMSSDPLPAGEPWIAPDGTEYIVVKVPLSEPTFPPEVKPAETEVRFYRNGNVDIAYRVPGFSFAIDLTNERILEIYNAARKNGA